MTIFEYRTQSAAIVLIQPVGDHDLPTIEEEVEEIKKRTDKEFQLIAVKVDDWNKDLSPWEAPAVFGKEDFGEGAKDTLTEIMNLCQDPNKQYYIGAILLQDYFPCGQPAGQSCFQELRLHRPPSGSRIL